MLQRQSAILKKLYGDAVTVVWILQHSVASKYRATLDNAERHQQCQQLRSITVLFAGTAICITVLADDRMCIAERPNYQQTLCVSCTSTHSLVSILTL